MTQIQKPGFDYQGFPVEFAEASKRRAEAIRQADASAGQNLLDMGRLLIEQRAALAEGTKRRGLRGGDTWLAWLRGELGWNGHAHAHRLIQISETFGDFDRRSISNLGFKKMMLLARKNTSPEVRGKVIEMARKGEAPTEKEIQKMRQGEDVAPAPSEAKKKAQETGKPVIGSDQRVYSPLEESKSAEYLHRRDRTYEMIDCVTFLSGMDMKAATAIKQAEKHWLKDLNIGEIEAAQKFLGDLLVAYKKHEGVIDGQ